MPASANSCDNDRPRLRLRQLPIQLLCCVRCSHYQIQPLLGSILYGCNPSYSSIWCTLVAHPQIPYIPTTMHWDCGVFDPSVCCLQLTYSFGGTVIFVAKGPSAFLRSDFCRHAVSKPQVCNRSQRKFNFAVDRHLLCEQTLSWRHFSFICC